MSLISVHTSSEQDVGEQLPRTDRERPHMLKMDDNIACQFQDSDPVHRCSPSMEDSKTPNLYQIR